MSQTSQQHGGPHGKQRTNLDELKAETLPPLDKMLSAPAGVPAERKSRSRLFDSVYADGQSDPIPAAPSAGSVSQ